MAASSRGANVQYPDVGMRVQGLSQVAGVRVGSGSMRASGGVGGHVTSLCCVLYCAAPHCILCVLSFL